MYPHIAALFSTASRKMCQLMILHLFGFFSRHLDAIIHFPLLRVPIVILHHVFSQASDELSFALVSLPYFCREFCTCKVSTYLVGGHSVPKLPNVPIIRKKLLQTTGVLVFCHFCHPQHACLCSNCFVLPHDRATLTQTLPSFSC